MKDGVKLQDIARVVPDDEDEEIDGEATEGEETQGAPEESSDSAK